MAHFDGTLVVTDPCYFVLDEHLYLCDNSYEHIERLGIKNCICTPTGIGDWHCQFYDSGTGIATGKNFSADSGTILVTTAEELAKYDLDFLLKVAKESDFWDDLVAVIPNFHGEVVVKDNGKYVAKTVELRFDDGRNWISEIDVW